jgi:hypothetical protein
LRIAPCLRGLTHLIFVFRTARSPRAMLCNAYALPEYVSLEDFPSGVADLSSVEWLSEIQTVVFLAIVMGRAPIGTGVFEVNSYGIVFARCSGSFVTGCV